MPPLWSYCQFQAQILIKVWTFDNALFRYSTTWYLHSIALNFSDSIHCTSSSVISTAYYPIDLHLNLLSPLFTPRLNWNSICMYVERKRNQKNMSWDYLKIPLAEDLYLQTFGRFVTRCNILLWCGFMKTFQSNIAMIRYIFKTGIHNHLFPYAC